MKCVLAALVLVAVIAAAVAASSGSRVRIGGVDCRPIISGGVICQVAHHPYSVGITKYLVIVWFRNQKVFVRSNIAPTTCIPLAGGGRICP